MNRLRAVSMVAAGVVATAMAFALGVEVGIVIDRYQAESIEGPNTSTWLYVCDDHGRVARDCSLPSTVEEAQ